ncbi:O-antigen ligase family protein [Billgrantia kenyensis]|uniref:O-antigen ligase-related domain-containing protein n=1 Tax=Billgrantia kenyensis TaxID=321266 RepID=A0A7W0AEE7_9GAMM|nr:hypothetical protein [Halomonas kenyensis]MBA2780246.1 hypothetical protein [Halomonas kenyensis]MCG6663098.1 hypothetical protein [Halomonas kenyensis]
MIIYALAGFFLVLGGGGIYWILLNPVRGIYLAFFSSGILVTMPLGPLREKVGLTELVIAITWAAMVINRKWIFERKFVDGRQRIALLAALVFLLIYAISCFVNNASFYGFLIPSVIETANIVYVVLLMITMLFLVQTPEQWKGCLFGWLAGAAVVSLVGFWAMTGSAPVWAYDEFSGRVSSTLRFENQVPSYLVPIMFIAMVWGALSTTSKLLRFILVSLIAAMAVTLVLTGSRTAFLLIIISLFCMAFIFLINLKNSSLMTGYLGLVIITSVVSLFLYVGAVIAAYDGHYSLGSTPSWQRPVVVLIEGSHSGVIDQSRGRQAELVIANADDAFILGHGPKLSGVKYRIDEIHNTFAGVFFEAGALGLVSLIILYMALFSCALRFSRSGTMNLLFIAAGVAFILLCLYGMTMYGLRQRSLWLMCGLLLSIPSVANHINRSVHAYPVR